MVDDKIHQVVIAMKPGITLIVPLVIILIVVKIDVRVKHHTRASMSCLIGALRSR